MPQTAFVLAFTIFWIVFALVGSTALLLAAWRRNRTATRLLKQAEESLARAEEGVEDGEGGYAASARQNRFPYLQRSDKLHAQSSVQKEAV